MRKGTVYEVGDHAKALAMHDLQEFARKAQKLNPWNYEFRRGLGQGRVSSVHGTHNAEFYFPPVP